MDYIIIRKNNIYYIKYMPTKELLNPCVIEDLRVIRDLINTSNSRQVEEYRNREQSILEILGCTKNNNTNSDEEINGL